MAALTASSSPQMHSKKTKKESDDREDEDISDVNKKSTSNLLIEQMKKKLAKQNLKKVNAELEEEPKFDKKGIMIERSKFPIVKMPTSTSDSLADSWKCFSRMIFPYKPEEFMTEIWEQKATIIKRKKFDYYDGLFSTNQLAQILEKNPTRWGVNLDVTSWTKTEGRQTHNLPGRAHSAQVWDFYNNGCSVRMLNPATYSNSVYEMCTNLQEFFGCFVGSNIYLTPPATQGFAPHYDDVEVFML